MLKKPKKDDIETTQFTANKPEDEKTAPPIPRPTPTPTSSPSDAKTTIGRHISIDGQIRGEEHLIIQGVMKGNVEMEKHNFTVGSNGRVDGEIRAQNVSISGQLKGAINAFGKVEVTKEADFLGDIKAKSISVEDGAYFKGSIELDREPHRKSSITETAKEPSSSPLAKAGYRPPTDTKKEP